MTAEDWRYRSSRRDEVLAYLRAHDRWVDGHEISSEACGGSEGIRRLRELRAMGWIIRQRRHPHPARHEWQYRLVPGLEPVPDEDAPEALTLW